jgi:hypothetical protein
LLAKIIDKGTKFAPTNPLQPPAGKFLTALASADNSSLVHGDDCDDDDDDG